MTLCKRKTISATSCDHTRQRVDSLIRTLPFRITPSELYNLSIGSTLYILERTPIEVIELSRLFNFCSNNTTYTPFSMTADERYLYDRQLREEGLSPLDALVQPVQARVEVIRAGADWGRLRA